MSIARRDVMAERSRDYHDYVFRDGKLVGEFEEMYRHSANVPWHQDEQAGWIDVRLTAEMLRDVAGYDEIHDLGCGLGYYLALLRQIVGGTDCRGFGYDVSQTACEQAAALFPSFAFRALDLTQQPLEAPVRPATQRARRLFAIRGTLWYVFPKMPQVVALIRSLMSEGESLLVVQNFPPLERPFIGKEVIPDHHALVGHFSDRFSLVRHLWYQDVAKTANDNWFIGLFSAGNFK